MPLSSFLKIYINIIFSSTRRSYIWSLLCRNFFLTSYVPHVAPISFFLVYHAKSNWRGLKTMKSRTVQSPPVACCFVPLRPSYLHQYPILKQPQSRVICQCQRPSYTPTITTKIFVVLYILVFKFLDSKLGHKRF